MARITPPSILLFACLAAAFCACSDKSQMESARRLERKGKFEVAWKKYQMIAADSPESPLAPEALFHAGLLSQRQLKDCYMAGTFYDRVIETYPQADPWARAALLQKQNCPDYFPLLTGTEWVEGDSETKGKNARIQILCKALDANRKTLPSEAGLLEKNYFAGDKKSTTIQLIYRKVDDEVREFQSDSDAVGKVVLKWPLMVGTQWKTRPANATFNYEIIGSSETVSVVAGDFSGCLKVQVGILGIVGASTNEYYAPGVGRILTTVSSKGHESRITELLSFKLGEWAMP